VGRVCDWAQLGRRTGHAVCIRLGRTQVRGHAAIMQLCIVVGPLAGVHISCLLLDTAWVAHWQRCVHTTWQDAGETVQEVAQVLCSCAL
jgi:hypothetical protein